MQRRHSLSHLFWRGLIAVGAAAATGVGVYPVANQSGVALWRAARGRRQPERLLRAVLGEWAVASLVAVARPLGFLGMPTWRRRVRGPRPIVLLHGYAMGRSNFLVLAQRLAGAGLGPLVGFEYGTLAGVAAGSATLEAFVEDVCTRLGVGQVDLVGHSLGGVIAHHYVSLGGGAGRVANLITLGSPHGGTPFSRFGFGRTAVDMQEDSALLRALATRPAPASVRLTAIWSRADGLVSSRAQARLVGAEMIEVEGLGHLALLASRRVAREVIARLSAAAAGGSPT